MTEQWQELKETIIDLRDSGGTGTQHEVCKYLVIYMDILEEQMVEMRDNQCSFCEAHEQGDTLYESSSWDGGIGFDYIHNINYCPLCGGRLKGGD